LPPNPFRCPLLYVNSYSPSGRDFPFTYKMKPDITFQERAKLGAEALAKQPPVTLEEMRAQSLRVRGDFPTQEEALKFVRTLTNEEYINYVKGIK
jgi:hypothetical protein